MEFEIKKTIDLHGVPCPLNFVKTKVALDELQIGDILEVVLDEGDAILNVTRSVKEEGHTVLKVFPQGVTFKVLIEKGHEE